MRTRPVDRGSRRRAVLAVLVAFAGGGLLTWWSLAGEERPPSSSGPWRIVDPTARRIEDISPVPGKTPASGGSRSEKGLSSPVVLAEPPGAAPLRVLVKDGSTGLPIPGASVAVYRDSPLAREAGLSLDCDRRAHGKTDPNGRCELRVAFDGLPYRVQASADGYADAECAGAPGGDIAITLPAGLALQGVVTDPAGTPAVGLRVEARTVGTSRLLLDAGAQGRPARTVATTESDAGGGFGFRSLSPGTYELSAAGDGWGPWHPRGHGTRPPERFLRAGRLDAHVIVRRIRALRLRLTDARTGQAIARDLAGRVSVERLEGVYFLLAGNGMSLSAGDRLLDARE